MKGSDVWLSVGVWLVGVRRVQTQLSTVAGDCGGFLRAPWGESLLTHPLGIPCGLGWSRLRLGIYTPFRHRVPCWLHRIPRLMPSKALLIALLSIFYAARRTGPQRATKSALSRKRDDTGPGQGLLLVYKTHIQMHLNRTNEVMIGGCAPLLPKIGFRDYLSDEFVSIYRRSSQSGLSAEYVRHYLPPYKYCG